MNLKLNPESGYIHRVLSHLLAAAALVMFAVLAWPLMAEWSDQSVIGAGVFEMFVVYAGLFVVLALMALTAKQRDDWALTVNMVFLLLLLLTSIAVGVVHLNQLGYLTSTQRQALGAVLIPSILVSALGLVVLGAKPLVGQIRERRSTA